MHSENITTPDGEAVKAELGLNSAVRQQAQARNAARQALDEVQRERQAPRLRAQARADQAAKVTPEALGVHDKLPDHHVFNQLSESRAKIAQSVQATFAQMSRALASPQLEGTQAITQVAALARDSLARHMTQIDEHRARLSGINESIVDRKIKAMQPPTHLASMVASARDALRGMKEEDRHRLMTNAKGDTAEVLMYAIGGAPAFLCGVPEGKQMETRTELLSIRDSEVLMLEPGMREAFAALDKMQAAIARLLGDTVDHSAADALKALRASAGKS